uniref:Protein E29 n=1 Tax=Elephant endotheliotropic herpesvirus 1A TaxID=759753 RepID=A0A866VUD8_ELHV1|nr:protein E29 [Elephant endotheliotropic herpesvirus 1A]QOE74911.1 protein E29 [Elephant endotheliotropic herpesvirus 1A]WES72379.1 protein E29 [Elephantid betaherpesvirus 1]WNZ34508.1 protein E29 [Elephant endotheliotropic herpesvirus 1A]
MTLILTPLAITLFMFYVTVRHGRRHFKTASVLVIWLNTLTVGKLSLDVYLEPKLYECSDFLIRVSVNAAIVVLVLIYVTRFLFTDSVFVTYGLFNSIRAYVLLSGFSLCFDLVPFSDWNNMAWSLDVKLSVYLAVSITSFTVTDMISARCNLLPRRPTLTISISAFIYYYIFPVCFSSYNIHIILFTVLIYVFTRLSIGIYTEMPPHPLGIFLRELFYKLLFCFGMLR